MRQKTIMKGLMKQYFINARCIRPRRTYKLGRILKAITLNNSLLLCDVINQLAHTSACPHIIVLQQLIDLL